MSIYIFSSLPEVFSILSNFLKNKCVDVFVKSLIVNFHLFFLFLLFFSYFFLIFLRLALLCIFSFYYWIFCLHIFILSSIELAFKCLNQCVTRSLTTYHNDIYKSYYDHFLNSLKLKTLPFYCSLIMIKFQVVEKYITKNKFSRLPYLKPTFKGTNC